MLMQRELILAFPLSLILAVGAMAQGQSAAPASPQPDGAKLENKHFFYRYEGKKLGIIAGRLGGNKAADASAPAEGVLVQEVIKESAADRAGLKAGDIIVEINGEAISSPFSLSSKLQRLDYDKPIPLRVIRQGESLQLSVTLDKRDNGFANLSPEDRQKLADVGKTIEKSMAEARRALEKARADMKAGAVAGDSKANIFYFHNGGRLGVATQPLTDQLRQYFGVDKGQGLLVSAVTENSAAAQAGLKAGDIILEFNGVAISNLFDMQREMRKVESGEARITRMRNHQKMEVRANLAPAKENSFHFEPDFSQLNFEMPEIEMPNFEIPNIEMPNFEMPQGNFEFHFDELPDVDGIDL
jgi:membrane-associated protease RseP (regulator of RpoE activity)